MQNTKATLFHFGACYCAAHIMCRVLNQVIMQRTRELMVDFAHTSWLGECTIHTGKGPISSPLKHTHSPAFSFI